MTIDADPARLPIVEPEPETFRVKCPVCDHPIEGIEMTQDDYGAWHADGPDEFPRCDECDTLFQVARVSVTPLREGPKPTRGNTR